MAATEAQKTSIIQIYAKTSTNQLPDYSGRQGTPRSCSTKDRAVTSGIHPEIH